MSPSSRGAWAYQYDPEPVDPGAPSNEFREPSVCGEAVVPEVAPGWSADVGCRGGCMKP